MTQRSAKAIEIMFRTTPEEFNAMLEDESKQHFIESMLMMSEWQAEQCANYVKSQGTIECSHFDGIYCIRDIDIDSILNAGNEEVEPSKEAG